MSSSVRRGVLFVLRLTVALGLVTWILWSVNLGDFWRTLKAVDLRYLPIVIVGSALANLLCAPGLAALLRVTHAVPLWSVVGACLKAEWAAHLLPAGTGQLSIPYFLRKYVDLGPCVAAVLMDKLITFAFTVALGSAGLVWIFDLREVALPIFLLATLCLSLLVAFAHPATRVRVRAWLPLSVRERLGGLYQAFSTYAHRGWWAIGVDMINTVTRSGVHAFVAQAALLALGQEVSFKVLFFLMWVLQTTSLYPISINGIGVVEGLAVLLLARRGVPAEATLGYALMLRVLNPVVLGLLFLMYELTEVHLTGCREGSEAAHDRW